MREHFCGESCWAESDPRRDASKVLMEDPGYRRVQLFSSYRYFNLVKMQLNEWIYNYIGNGERESIVPTQSTH